MRKLTGPIIELHLMGNNSVVIDKIHDLIHFKHLTMQVKSASNEATAKPQSVLTDDALTIPPRTTKTVTSFVDHPLEWNTTGTLTPSEKFTETGSLLISHSMSIIFDKRVAVRVTNTTESTYLIRNDTQIAEISIVTPEYNKPVDMSILNMIPQGDPDPTAYLNELLRTKKLEQQNDTFRIPTPETLQKPKNHIPTEIQFLKEIILLRKKKTQSTREHRIPNQIVQTV